MKKAHYNETNGQILGWYDIKIHSSIPSPNIEVTDEVWKKAISINANHITVDGICSVADLRTELEIQEDFRAERNKILTEVIDFYQKPLVWGELTPSQQEDIVAYRIALKDATLNWVMPTKPDWL